MLANITISLAAIGPLFFLKPGRAFIRERGVYYDKYGNDFVIPQNQNCDIVNSDLRFYKLSMIFILQTTRHYCDVTNSTFDTKIICSTFIKIVYITHLPNLCNGKIEVLL